MSHSSSRRVSHASSTLELSILPYLKKEREQAAQPLMNYDGKHLMLSAVLNFVDSTDYMVACQVNFVLTCLWYRNTLGVQIHMVRGINIA